MTHTPSGRLIAVEVALQLANAPASETKRHADLTGTALVVADLQEDFLGTKRRISKLAGKSVEANHTLKTPEILFTAKTRTDIRIFCLRAIALREITAGTIRRRRSYSRFNLHRQQYIVSRLSKEEIPQ